RNIEKLHHVMDRAINGAPTAKATIDIAIYDLVGKGLEVPAYILLGGRYHERFPITHVLSIDSPDNMADSAESFLEDGYTSFKLKVGYDVWDDIERIKAVHQRVGDRAVIRVDVNQGWDTAPATLQALQRLENISLDWLEQPVVASDIDALAEIKEKSSVSI